MNLYFMFATGIENSAPAVAGRRVDELAKCGHDDSGPVNALGLYDHAGRIRPVGKACKQLTADWRHILPTQSVCLDVPVTLPGEYDDPMAARRREWLRGSQGRQS